MTSMIFEFEAIYKRFFRKNFPKELIFVLLLISALYTVGTWLDSREKHVMRGDWNIAIAGFYSFDSLVVSDQDLYLLGYQFYDKVDREFQKNYHESNLSIQIWGPDEIATVTGETIEERAENARRVSENIQADIVLYGTIERIGGILYLQTEFFVAAENSYELEEIIGHHTLGGKLPIIRAGEEIPPQTRLNDELIDRTIVFSLIAEGLSLFSYHDYDGAYSKFIEANSSTYWESNENREAVYLLIGNSAGRSLQITEAELAFSKALEIKPDYSRALVGLAGIRYLQSLDSSSEGMFAPNLNLLNEAESLYNLAKTMYSKPVNANIDSKISFGLGQVNLVKWFAGEDTLEFAENFFNQVINKFENGSNPHIHELAAESHARLGLIQRQLSSLDSAVLEFKTALSLSTSPQRRGLYWATIAELLTTQGKEGANEAYLEAIGEYRIALLLTSTDKTKAKLLFEIAKIYVTLGNSNEAITSLNDAIALTKTEAIERKNYEELLLSLQKSP